METTRKLHPGQPFQPITLSRLDGDTYTFGDAGSWEALFIYRGKHCPRCREYLGKIQSHLEAFNSLGISVAAASGDSEIQARVTMDAVKPNFPLLFGLPESEMHRLGLYVSAPRSENETDHNFPEPALFVVNPDRELHIVDIANAPFVRPDLEALIDGIGFIMERRYPVRGTVR